GSSEKADWLNSSSEKVIEATRAIIFSLRINGSARYPNVTESAAVRNGFVGRLWGLPCSKRQAFYARARSIASISIFLASVASPHFTTFTHLPGSRSL